MGDGQRSLGERRIQAYKTLLSLGLPHLFPQGVDVALNYQGPSPLSKYIASPAFLRTTASKYSDYDKIQRTNEWTLSSVASGLLPDGTLLFDLYIRRFVFLFFRKYPMTGLSQRNDWNEVYSIMQVALLQYIPRFKPMERAVDKQPRFYSFEGFLTAYAFNQAKRQLIQESKTRSRFTEFNEETHGPLLAEPLIAETLQDDPSQRLEIENFLDAAQAILTTPEHYDLFYGTIYRGKTTKYYAKKLDISTRAVQSRLTSLLEMFAARLQTLREHSNLDLDTNKHRFSHFKKAWKTLFPEELFLKKLSRPALLKKEKNRKKRGKHPQHSATPCKHTQHRAIL